MKSFWENNNIKCIQCIMNEVVVEEKTSVSKNMYIN